MPKVTVVTHCWAVNRPVYAALLRAQLSSLLLCPQGCDFQVVLFYDAADVWTNNVRRHLTPYCPWLQARPLLTRQMWRRAIGRNSAALADLDSDLIWFTDCDYLFGNNCLNSAYLTWNATGRPAMLWPRQALANQVKEPIDDFCKVALKSTGAILPTLDCEILFSPHKFSRAIGGIQCVSGEYARKNGYLPNSKWQKAPDRPFPDFRDDVAFRKNISEAGIVLGVSTIHNLYRLRHTEIGYGAAGGSAAIAENL